MTQGEAHDESCVSFGAISDTARGKNGQNARFRVQLCHFWGKNCHSYVTKPLVLTETATGHKKMAHCYKTRLTTTSVT
jgi:hypothetical protein